jgi:GTP-binding protein YchF
LFNALLKKQIAFVANYPFATIEPNVGIVPVPDSRLERLAQITKDEETMSGFPPIKPATVNFVDIAGLVKGASEGAGLGNKFLSHIREVSIIAHVVRASEDENIIKEGSVDPKSDYSTIQTELILADLESLAKLKVSSIKKPSILSSIDGKRQEVIEKIYDSLNRGIPVRDIDFLEEEKELIKNLFLLSAKPEIVVLNVSEDDYSKEKIPEITARYKKLLSVISIRQLAERNPMGSLTDVRDDRLVVICAKIEAELAELTEEEQKQYLADLGLKQSGLERLIKKAYETLGLISFLTSGEKEVRAWTIRSGSTALMASGTIHTDFMQKFIKAEVVSYEEFVKNNGWKQSRELGKARMEGRDYVMQDGDVVEFKIGS